MGTLLKHIFMLVKTRRITAAHACARAHTEREAYWKLMLTCVRLIGTIYGPFGASQVALVVKNLPADAGDIRDAGLIPGVGMSPGEGHGNPPQYSCLENPINRILVGYSPWARKEADTTTAISDLAHNTHMGPLVAFFI